MKSSAYSILLFQHDGRRVHRPAPSMPEYCDCPSGTRPDSLRVGETADSLSTRISGTGAHERALVGMTAVRQLPTERASVPPSPVPRSPRGGSEAHAERQPDGAPPGCLLDAHLCGRDRAHHALIGPGHDGGCRSPAPSPPGPRAGEHQGLVYGVSYGIVAPTVRSLSFSK